MNTTATRIHTTDAAVTVVSTTPSITAWSARYFGHWWNAAAVPAENVCADPLVVADVDPNEYADLATIVAAHPHEDVTYAKAKTLVTRDGNGTVMAISPSEGLAYRSETATGRLTISGHEPEPVALAAARLARDMVRGQLLRSGWSVLHASAVVRDGRTVLTLGSKGAGKTTTALLLAARGWNLLANDRVFVRPNHAGGVDVLPWPSAAALGLGLLDALGWYDVTRERLQSGERLHPTQDQRVTDALMGGARGPLWEKGRELKVQVLPDQFGKWFGVGLASAGQASTLLFPCIEAGATPALTEDARGLQDADFMSGVTEDRYPDIFGLAHGIDGGGRSEAREALVQPLAALPHHGVVLGHDITANADFLAKLAAVA